MPTPTPSEKRERFRHLHDEGIFVLPNAWDVGSAKLLASRDFGAIATTSSGHAASLGRHDQQVTRAELLAHVAHLTAAVDLPVSVDAEHGFADSPSGVGATVAALADVGAAGCSIEDYDPSTTHIMPLDVAVDRVAAAAAAARETGLVLTARAENHLYGIDDLDDTITRLRAYGEAGADVLYAPGLTSLDDIRRVVDGVDAPVNVLAGMNVPPVDELAAAGVRRVSTGGALAFAAYGALVKAAQELLDHGTSTYAAGMLSRRDREAAFGQTG